jgi:hypothetical protein
MQRSIRPAWLLRQADEFGYRYAGRGQPRNADLRRSVSSAYYALFHGVTLAASRHLLPGGTVDERQRLARSFTHKNVRTACEYVLGRASAPMEARPIAKAAGSNPLLSDVADAILTLQQARHLADYDHRAAFDKIGVLGLVDNARDALSKLSALSGSADLDRFLSLLALRPSLM